MEVKNNPTMEIVILETAERLFLEKGFALTSTTEIAKEVGCNQALIHYYYRTKENLFNHIFETKFRQFFRSIFELDNVKGLSFTEKLTYIIGSHFDMVRKNPKLPILIFNEFTRNPEMANSLKNKLEGVVNQITTSINSDLQNEIKAGRIREISLIDLIFCIISSNISLFLILPVASEILSLDNQQKEIIINHRRDENIRMILNGIKP